MSEKIIDQKRLCERLYEFVLEKCPYNLLRLELLRQNLEEDTLVNIDMQNDTEESFNLKSGNLFFFFTLKDSIWDLKISIYNPEIALSILPKSLEISASQIKPRIIDDSDRFTLNTYPTSFCTILINSKVFGNYHSDVVIKWPQMLIEWIRRNYTKIVNEETDRIRKLLADNTALVEKIDELIFSNNESWSTDAVTIFSIDNCFRIATYFSHLHTTRYRIKRRLSKISHKP